MKEVKKKVNSADNYFRLVKVNGCETCGISISMSF